MNFFRLALALGLLFASTVLPAATIQRDVYYAAGDSRFQWNGRYFSLIREYRIHALHVMRTAFPPRTPRTVVVVPGFGDSGKLFEPFAKALIDGGKAEQVFIIDMPSLSGPSTLSTSAAFGPRVLGETDVEEYVQIVGDVLSSLRASGTTATTLVGHSIGGLVIQRLQSDLRLTGSDVLARYGTQNTVLISSDIPEELAWGGAAFAGPLVTSLTVDSRLPLIGKYVALSYDSFIQLKFTNFTGTVVEGAPTATQALELNKPEPFAAAANIVGLDPTGATTESRPRMSIPGGLWTGRNLKVVWLSQDGFFAPAEVQALANHLKPGLVAAAVDHPDAVHAAPYSSPELLVPLF
jgi:pimeloyl-ACP methyl ester carboxylesterase